MIGSDRKTLFIDFNQHWLDENVKIYDEDDACFWKKSICNYKIYVISSNEQKRILKGLKDLKYILCCVHSSKDRTILKKENTLNALACLS